MGTKASLTFFCGKMAAGKSTKAKALVAEKNAVLISEDEWLTAHYPRQINNFDEYLKFSTLIRPFIKSHVQNILKTGAHVVMDFPANTPRQRAWLKQLCDEIGCVHELIFLDLSNDDCLAQLEKRRVEQPERAKFDNEAVFKHVTQFFEAPLASEGINVVHLTGNE